MPLEIAQLGQPVLRQVAVEVPAEQFANPAFQEFLAAMMETLREQKGAGLAAPQVFVGLRVFLAMIVPPPNDETPAEFETFINPTISLITEETSAAWEGCLSFPELLVLVPRYRSVRIDYRNANGEPRAIELEGFPARVVQHEFDHIEGILTLDRAESTLDIIKASEIEDVVEARKEDE